MSPNEILAWSGLAIGVAFGALGQSTGFCLNRAVKDYVESKNLLKARSFALAMLVAIVGAQLLAITELIDFSTAIYRTPNFSWLLLPLGATMFGYGMMLANGCGARTVVLLAQGNLRSLVVLLCLGISAYATLSGVLGPLRTMLAQATSVPLGGLYEWSSLSNRFLAGLLLVTLAWFVFFRGMILRSAKDFFGGLGVGLLVVAVGITDVYRSDWRDHSVSNDCHGYALRFSDSRDLWRVTRLVCDCRSAGHITASGVFYTTRDGTLRARWHVDGSRRCLRVGLLDWPRSNRDVDLGV